MDVSGSEIKTAARTDDCRLTSLAIATTRPETTAFSNSSTTSPQFAADRPIPFEPMRMTRAHRGGSGPPLVCLHGFTDTWRTWELVLPALERRHDALAVTLAGHAGGPAIEGEVTGEVLADAVEHAMDVAGFETAHLAGNSLGGYVALQLAARGRAESVVALAPAGGWARGDESYKATLAYFARMQHQLKAAMPHVEALLASPEGRRLATRDMVTNVDHIPVGLIAHLMRGAASYPALLPLIRHAEREGWPLAAEAIACPVRIVWGTD